MAASKESGRATEAEADATGATAAGPGVSGLYRSDASSREELRLDVAGRYPQNMVSGSVSGQWHWVAEVERDGADRWAGSIILSRAPGGRFPWTRIEVEVSRGSLPEQHTLELKMRRPGGVPRRRSFSWESPVFGEMDLEVDWEQGEAATLSVDTCAHPNRPSLACRNLTVEEVFREMGFAITTSPGGPVPRAEAGVDRRWTPRELHDAMQSFWSLYAPRAQWAIWVFFASLYKEDDPHQPDGSTGGLMFDDIGPQERQGTAVFTDSFISDAPPGDPDPAAQDTLYETLSARQVQGSRVPDAVLREVDERRRRG